MVISAKKSGYSFFFIPQENLYELEYISGIYICPIAHFSEIMEYFLENKAIAFVIDKKDIRALANEHIIHSDFKHIKGHSFAKRALSVAASGLHNVLMV